MSAKTWQYVHFSISVVLFAILYRYWLVAPVLVVYTGADQWRLLASAVAAACGGTLSLLRVPILAVSCGAILGLLLGGTWVEWKAPNDVPVSVGAAFRSHLESFWGQTLMLTLAATLGATVPRLSNRVKALVKTMTFIVISLLAFAVLALTYSTSKGYTQWFFRVRHAAVMVNGMPSGGWLHRTHDGNGMFFTEHRSDRSVTYDLVFTDSGNSYVFSCGTWVAPRWPAIPVGDVNPPCFLMGSAGQKLIRGINFVSFTTLDGRKLQADW